MDHHAGRITIIASSTMVHQRARCMICDQPVDHRVVFMTNDARVLHAGCIPDHVKVPTTVLLQAIRRLERMLARAREEDGSGSSPKDKGSEDRAAEDSDPEPGASEDRDPEPGGPEDESPENRGPDPGLGTPPP